MTLSSLRNASLTLVATAAFTCSAALAQSSGSYNGGQQPSGSSAQPSSSGQYSNGSSGQQTQRRGDPATSDLSVPDKDGPHNWTEQQILTATVHQAWELSGKNEANFFEIVRELAEISARNRNVSLPDDQTAGRRAGQYIREQARADHDQLLYAIVDKAVQMTGTKSATSAANSTTH
jgi:hypothetical protein